MGYLAIVFIVDVLVSTLCVWLATKFSFVKLEFKIIAVIVFLVSVVSLIPVIGWFLGILLFIFLLMKEAKCTPVDALWVVIFTKVVAFAAAFLLLAVFNV